MAITISGIMQAPVTPFKDDYSFDFVTFEKMVDFHVRHGAPAITWPYHKSESMNLTIAERKRGVELLIKTVAKRIPVLVFVGALSEDDSVALAKHAEKAGADAVIAISPYCRRPSHDEIFNAIVRIATSVSLPIVTYNSPWRNGENVEFTGELTRRLIDRLPNFAGMKDASFHSEKFMEISRVVFDSRPDFALFIGVEHLAPAFPLGAVGSSSSTGAISPNFCRKFHQALLAHDWKTARECQYRVSQLWRLFKDQYPSSLKGAMSLMGRPVGPARSPLPTVSKERLELLRARLDSLGIFETEPQGW
jgi:dihydrodipicolinate synthase/N-acetylneuraminate lyase